MPDGAYQHRVLRHSDILIRVGRDCLLIASTMFLCVFTGRGFGLYMGFSIITFRRHLKGVIYEEWL